MKRLSLRKLLKWITTGLLLAISVVILTVTFLNWSASREVEARLAPLREAGKPTSIQALRPSAVPDEQNAAKAVEQQGDALRQFDRQHAEATRDSETEAQSDAAALRVAKNVRHEFPDLNDELRAASRLPAYQRDLDYSGAPSALMDQVLEPADSPRTIVRALYGHGLMLLADGNTDEAVADAIAIVKWSKHVARQPLLVNFLIATACYGQGIRLAAKCLDAGDASLAVRAALLKECSDESRMFGDFAYALDTERAFGISSLDSFPLSRFQFMLGELAAYLDNISEFKSFADKPTGIAPNEPTKTGIFAELSWPAIQGGLVALRRQQTLSRAVQILAAWQDAGSDSGAALADLDLPSSVTIDPLDGTPMKMQDVGNTIVIYSVGMDMVDDGGSIEDGRDIGISATCE